MFTIYRWEGGALKEVPELTGACWINLADPSTEEIARAQELTRVPREFLTDPLDKDERPRLEIDEGVTLLIVHVPYHEPHENLIPFHTLPLGIVLTDSHVITICNRQTPVTSTFLDQIRRVCPPRTSSASRSRSSGTRRFSTCVTCAMSANAPIWSSKTCTSRFRMKL